MNHIANNCKTKNLLTFFMSTIFFSSGDTSDSRSSSNSIDVLTGYLIDMSHV